METEKITLNLSPVELGKIDLLVEHGLFSNRSDFIRAALRQYLTGFEEDIKAYLQPAFPEAGTALRELGFIGVCRVTKSDLDKLKTAGEKCRITAVGVLNVDKKITPALFTETVEYVKVYGACIAGDEIKAIIAQA